MATGSRTLPGLALLLAACSGVEADGLGRCAESTPDWWPLRVGASWTYDQTFFNANPGEERDLKRLEVESTWTAIGGLLGDDHGIRTWRQERGERGTRWLFDDGLAYYWRRDVWFDTASDDPGLCQPLVPIRDVYYGTRQDLEDGWARARLDYSPERVCEGSEWTARYRKQTITIGEGDPEPDQPAPCSEEIWCETEAMGCEWAEEEVEESWSVEDVDRTVTVPAGTSWDGALSWDAQVFPHCLCVHRHIPDIDPVHARDVTYCFARGVGKVYEFDARVSEEVQVAYEMPAE